jgi:hypothetical protein
MCPLVVLDHLELVVQIDQAEDGLNVVVPIGTFPEDVESQVDFRVCPDFHLKEWMLRCYNT